MNSPVLINSEATVLVKAKDYRVDLVKLAMELFLLTDAEKIAVYYMLKPDVEATLAQRKIVVPTTPTTR